MIKIKHFVMGHGSTNCYILVDENKNCVIVDCEGNSDIYIKYFEDNNLKPSYIFLTHGHADHIGAVNKLKEKYNCKVCAGENEQRLLKEPTINLSHFMGGDISIIPDILLKDKQKFDVGNINFTVMNTPGHTEGSICLFVEDCIFTGDTLFQGSCGRTDLETGNHKEILESLKKLSNIEENYRVFCGHGPSTTLDIERETNPFMR